MYIRLLHDHTLITDKDMARELTMGGAKGAVPLRMIRSIMADQIHRVMTVDYSYIWRMLMK